MVKKRTELSAQEVAERCGVTLQTVTRWCRAGRFAGARQERTARGAEWHIPAADLDALAATSGRSEPARGKSPKELQSRKEARQKREKAKAIARWEGEGGAPLPLREQAEER